VPHSTSVSLRPSAAPPSADAWIAAVAERQHGLITVRQLLAVLSSGAITQRAHRGALHRRHKGVYVVGQPRLSREGEWLAAALACGGALGFRSCGLLHGVSRFPERTLEVVTTRRVRMEGVTVHTVRQLDPRDLTSHLGIPCTSIHRLLVDFTDEHTPHQVANVIHKAAFLGRYVEPAVRDAMERAKGRRKLGVLDRAIEMHRMGSAGTRSGAEDACLALVRTEPRVNMELLGFAVDFRWPEQRLVVEVDGAQHALRADADRARDRVLREAGWTVLRFSDREVYEQPSGVRALLDAMADGDDRVDRRQQLAAELRQRVLDRRW
jgi:predicted transcriptional regulator of viral defense system